MARGIARASAVLDIETPWENSERAKRPLEDPARRAPEHGHTSHGPRPVVSAAVAGFGSGGGQAWFGEAPRRNRIKPNTAKASAIKAPGVGSGNGVMTASRIR